VSLLNWFRCAFLLERQAGSFSDNPLRALRVFIFVSPDLRRHSSSRSRTEGFLDELRQRRLPIFWSQGLRSRPAAALAYGIGARHPL
jgi:hypothetical protein